MKFSDFGNSVPPQQQCFLIREQVIRENESIRARNKQEDFTCPECSQVLEKIVPAMNTPSLNYFVQQYLCSTKNKVSFDPIGALSHFVVPGLDAKSSSSELLEAVSNCYFTDLRSFVDLDEYILIHKYYISYEHTPNRQTPRMSKTLKL